MERLEKLEQQVAQLVARLGDGQREQAAQAASDALQRAESDVGAIATLLSQQNRAGEEDAGRLVKRVEALEDRLAKRAPPPCPACAGPTAPLHSDTAPTSQWRLRARGSEAERALTRPVRPRPSAAAERRHPRRCRRCCAPTRGAPSRRPGRAARRSTSGG